MMNNFKKDAYSNLLMLLFLSSDNPKYSLLNELVYLLDEKSFLNFITYFSGQTIEIPPKDELISALNTLLLYQYNEIDKLPWKEALAKVGIPQSESYNYKFRLDRFKAKAKQKNYSIRTLLKQVK